MFYKHHSSLLFIVILDMMLDRSLTVHTYTMLSHPLKGQRLELYVNQNF